MGDDDDFASAEMGVPDAAELKRNIGVTETAAAAAATC